MIYLLDIINDIDFNNDFEKDNYLNLELQNNYFSENNNLVKNNIIEKNLKKNEIYHINIKIISYLGSGSYGKVYKILFKKNFYALKISQNEIPLKLKQRYLSLKNNDKLEKYIIDINLCGKIMNGNKYIYYSIMEYGGEPLKEYCDIKDKNIKIILNQLIKIINIIKNYRILLTDFKLSNVTIDENYKLKIIDIYMYCETYSPNCKACKIVKTYPTLEIEKEFRIYENSEYNFTFIYIPLAVCLIDLLCKRNTSYYCLKLSNKYMTSMGVKEALPLLQIASYNYSNESNNKIKLKYKNIYKYKKKIEKKYPYVKEPEFYENFLNMIDIKSDYKNIMSNKKFLLILNKLLSCLPEERSIEELNIECLL